jgi:hypothetical protein
MIAEITNGIQKIRRLFGTTNFIPINSATMNASPNKNPPLP